MKRGFPFILLLSVVLLLTPARLATAENGDGPDLVITDIVWTPETVRPDDEVAFTITYKNEGNTDFVTDPADAQIGLKLIIQTTSDSPEETAAAVGEIDQLPAGETNQVTVSLMAPEAGEYRVVVELDTENVVSEANEDNNVFSNEALFVVTAEAAEIPAIQITQDSLNFYLKRWIPFAGEFDFDPREVHIFTAGDQPVTVQILGRDLDPKAVNIASDATGVLKLIVNKVEDDQTLSIVNEWELIDILPGERLNLSLEPDSLTKVGEYEGTITVRMVPPAGHEGNVSQEMINVTVRTSDQPLFPLLFIVVGVVFAGLVVSWRGPGLKEATLKLRAAGLNDYWSRLVANAQDQNFSDRLAPQMHHYLREAQRKQAERDWNGAAKELDEAERVLDDHAVAIARFDEAEQAFKHTRQALIPPPDWQHRQIAGQGMLTQARLALDAGEPTAVVSYIQAAIKIRGRAIGLYRRLQEKREGIENLLRKYSQLKRVALNVQQAMANADQKIDSLTLTGDKVETATVQTADAEKALTQVGYWFQALSVVANAISKLPNGCDSGKRQIDKALDLMSKTAVEHLPIRDDKSNDKLQQAEAAAGAALTLCPIEPWLREVKRWLPKDDGSEVWTAYTAAEMVWNELKGDDFDKAISNARQALVLHRLTELRRVTWRWQAASSDPKHLAAAIKYKNDGAWEAAKKELDKIWEKNWPPIITQLIDEIKFAAEEDGPAVLIFREANQEKNDRKWERAAAIIRQARPEAYASLVNYFLFELETLAQLKEGQDGWARLDAAKKAKEPFLKVGLLKQALDSTVAQALVAGTLFDEAALVNHGPNHEGWGSLSDACTALENEAWTEGLWKARLAWYKSRQQLADYYIEKAKAGYQAPDHPGWVKLQEAETAKTAARWTRAAWRAREAWQQLISAPNQNLVNAYNKRLGEDAKDKWEALQPQVKELTDKKEYKQAFALILKELLYVSIKQADNTQLSQCGAIALARAKMWQSTHPVQALHLARAALAKTNANVAAGVDPLDYFKRLSASPSLPEQVGPAIAGTIMAFVGDPDTLSPLEIKRVYEEVSGAEAMGEFEARPNLLKELKALETEANKGIQNLVSAAKVDLENGLLNRVRANIEQAKQLKDSIKELEEKLRIAAEALNNIDGADQLAAWRTVVQRELNEAWRELAAQQIPEAEAALQQADRLIGFLNVENQKRIISQEFTDDNPGWTSLQEARHAFAEHDISKATDFLKKAETDSKQWSTRENLQNNCIPKPHNLGVYLETDKSKLPSPPLSQIGEALGFVLFRRDKKTSPPLIGYGLTTDDLLSLQLVIRDANMANYTVEWWYKDNDNDTGKWEKKPSVPGRGQHYLLLPFQTPGIKQIGFNVKHKEVKDRELWSNFGDATFPNQKRFFAVTSSRHSALQNILQKNLRRETVVVIFIASLIGLTTRYYGISAEANTAEVSTTVFGTWADYSFAFLWGATAKATVEIFKSIPNWLETARQALTSQSSQGSSGSSNEEEK